MNQPNLFGEPAAPASTAPTLVPPTPSIHPEKAAPYGWFEVAARERAKHVPTTHEVCIVEVMLSGKPGKESLTDTTKVTFMARGEPYKSGKRKGELRWLPATSIDVYVRREDVADTERAFEARTGECSLCVGGSKMVGWKGDDPTFGPCDKCGGTGHPKT